ncbi:tetraspanin-18-like [Mytilus galloprovincialis]|uniref:tetraspanin-18-like n=1 Tax=Mytilus galloprovincialis TaxID=29158 RepID=UPI003F7B5B3B
MAEGNCAKCSRYLLIVFNFLFWVCGGGLLGIGLWLRFDNDIYKKLEDTVQLELDLPSDVIFPAAYALIAAGGFIFLTGFCGCCGAIRESFCMLGVYITCLIIVILAELAAGIYLAIQRADLEDMFHTHLLSEVRNYTIDNNSSMDYIQKQFQCCGSRNYSEYEESIQFRTGQESLWVVPESCCKSNIRKCQEEAKLRVEFPSQLYSEGCHTVILDWFITNSAVLVGVAGGIACFGILGIIFASILCRNRTEYYDWE